MNVFDFDLYINDASRRELADKLIMHCGVPTYLEGYRNLQDCVVLSSFFPNDKLGKIYCAVGLLQCVAPRSIARNITYALDRSPSFAPLFSELVGVPFASAEIHSRLVISYLGKIVAKPSLSPLYNDDISQFLFEQRSQTSNIDRKPAYPFDFRINYQP